MCQLATQYNTTDQHIYCSLLIKFKHKHLNNMNIKELDETRQCYGMVTCRQIWLDHQKWEVFQQLTATITSITTETTKEF